MLPSHAVMITSEVGTFCEAQQPETHFLRQVSTGKEYPPPITLVPLGPLDLGDMLVLLSSLPASLAERIASQMSHWQIEGKDNSFEQKYEVCCPQ